MLTGLIHQADILLLARTLKLPNISCSSMSEKPMMAFSGVLSRD